MRKHFIGRVLTIVLIMTLALVVSAFAEGEFSLNGRVIAGERVSLTAPYGGKVLDYTVRVGDMVQPGEIIFSVETTKIYAPMDGVIGGVRVQPGDETAFIEAQYGALMYLEPDVFVIDTTVSDAYDKNENRIVHVGETVYLRSTNNNSRTGVGYVTKVENKNFSVEVVEGNLNFDEKASIFRRDDYDGKSRIGSGKTARRNAAAITGSGIVLKVHVSEGQGVKRGDLLVEMAEGEFSGYEPSAKEQEISGAAIVKEIAVQPGQKVNKGDVLATVHPVERLQIAADINEMDLGRVKVGDAVRVAFDAGVAETVEGTVSDISALSHSESGDAEYKVYVEFTVGEWILEGMSATVYIKE